VHICQSIQCLWLACSLLMHSPTLSFHGFLSGYLFSLWRTQVRGRILTPIGTWFWASDFRCLPSKDLYAHSLPVLISILTIYCFHEGRQNWIMLASCFLECHWILMLGCWPIFCRFHLCWISLQDTCIVNSPSDQHRLLDLSSCCESIQQGSMKQAPL